MPADSNARFGILIDTARRGAEALASARRDFDLLQKSIQSSGDVSKTTNQRMADLSRSLDLASRSGARLHTQATSLEGRSLALKASFDSLVSAMGAMPGQAGRAASSLESLGASIMSAGKSAGVTTIVIAALVAAMVTVGVVALRSSRDISNYQESLDQLADRTGLTTGEIGALRVAAAASGRSWSEVERSVDFFTRRIGEAATGNADAARSFESLGVSIRDGATNELRPTGDILRDVSAELRGIESEATRSARAWDLFGRSGSRSLVVFTSELDKMAQLAQQRGIIFSPDTEAALRRVDTAFDNLSSRMTGLKNSFQALIAVRVEPFLTAVDSAITKVEAWRLKIQEFMDDEKVKTWMSLVGWFQREGKTTAVTVGHDPEGGAGGVGGGVLGPPLALANQEHLKRIAIEAQFNEMLQQASDKRRQAEFEELSRRSRLAGTGVDGATISGTTVRGLQVSDPAQAAIEENEAFWEEVVRSIARARKAAESDTQGQVEQGRREREERQRKAFDSARKNQIALNAVGESFDIIVNHMVSGTQRIEAAMLRLIAIVLSALGQANNMPGLGIVSGLLGTVAGLFQKGGEFVSAGRAPVRAQTGLVMSGIRGRDTNLAAVGAGEMIVSHARTDQLGRVMDRLEPFLASGAGVGGGTTIVNLNFSDGAFNVNTRMSRSELRPWLREDVIPELSRIASGSRQR